jgi:manganese/zinc/iron transport system substrate-binding protein
VQKILKILLRKFYITLILFNFNSAHAQLNITTTTGMIADLVSNISQDKAKVTALMRSGVDPHLYKATQGDIRKLSRADIIFYNGLHLEGKLQPILQKMSLKKTVVAVSDDIPKHELIHYGQLHDPHIWFDVSLWIQAAKKVTQTLIHFDAPNAQFYQANLDRYTEKLQTLDTWVQAQVLNISPEQRILITAHDAFGYFGKAYGLEVRGLQGISTAGEFGLQDIKQLKDLIVKKHIGAVFIESSVSPKFIESLVAGARVQGHSLIIGGELYSDAMGTKGSGADNYIGMVQHNVNTIVKGLAPLTTKK